ncbi:MAG: hypothetical protein MUE51_10790 [Thermoleophilia bacterium]|nr:hypothetical protein [Thermoleophilia bacterium]
MSAPAPLVALGFGTYARADRVYAIRPIGPEARGPGRRTLVWVEGITEPLVASRSEGAILRDLGADVPGAGGGLIADALGLVQELARQSAGVGALLRRQIKAEAGLDLDALEAHARALLDRAPAGGGQESLFP